jgi:hypothetical protein
MITVIQSQAAKVWKLLTDTATLETYKQALGLTWTLLQETGRLLWLLVCAILVGFAWLLGTSLWAGKAFRTWTTQLEQPSSEPLLDKVGKGIITASKTSVNLALTTAMEQLGITETPKAIQDVMPSVVPAPTTSLPTTVTAPAVAQASSSQSPASVPVVDTTAQPNVPSKTSGSSEGDNAT